MESPTSILSWPQALAGALLASIGAILGYLYRRKKLPSEVHRTDAEAGLIEAQAGDLRLKTRLSALEMFDEMAADLGEAQWEKVQLKQEIVRLKEQIRVLNAQVDKFEAERKLNTLKTNGID